LAEQQRIVTEVDRHLTLIRETETQVDTNLKRAERLRQSILGKAFTGELVSTVHSVPDAEPEWPMVAEPKTRYGATQ
jgi:hypothetical protein